jgi:Multiubiquitin
MEALTKAEPKDKDRDVAIHIDNKPYKTSKNPMTGAELKQLGGIAGNYDLWQKVPGGDDKLIKDGDSVQLKNGDHFYSAPSSLNPGS